MLTHWLRSLFATKRSPLQKRRTARLDLLPLEDRITPVTAFALSGSNLLRFDVAAPTLAQSTPIAGVDATETLVGIDFRPQNGLLYGLGVNAATNRGTLYVISTSTGSAAAIGATGSVAPEVTTGALEDLPDPAAGAGYGFDFNPTNDLIRVTTSNGLNFRVDPNTGLNIDGDNGMAAPVLGNNTDADFSGGPTGVSGAAYTNNQPGATATTLYVLDGASNMLFIQGASNPPGPNGGVLTGGTAVTLNGAPLDFSEINGFDVQAGVNVTTSGMGPTSADTSAFAVLNVGGTTALYRINLLNAQATRVGNVGNGTTAVQGLAIQGDFAGSVAFASATYSVREGGTATITLTRTNGSNGTLTVMLYRSSGTALATDVSFVTDSVTFADGQTTATLSLVANHDGIVEGNETVVLLISAVSAPGVIGPQATTTVTITDSDRRLISAVGVGPTVSVSGPTVTGPNSDVQNSQITNVTPFPNYAGSVSIAAGDVNGDGTDDLIAGATSSTGAVKVFDGVTYAEIRSFFPFANYNGGTYVASGDVTGDGRDDVIVGATVNGHVKVFDGVTGAEVRSFFAYVNFAGEVRVSVGEFNGDGFEDVVTGAGSGAFGHVKVFSGLDNSEMRSFLAYTNFNGGIFVASGDVTGDQRDDIVTGAEANGHVKVFDGVTNLEVRSFFAFPGFAGQARVATRSLNVNLGDEIFAAQGPTGTSTALISTFDGQSLVQLSAEPVADPGNFGIFLVAPPKRIGTPG